MTRLIRLGLILAALLQPALAAQCVPPGRWIAPGKGELDAGSVLARASAQSVLLLGETHDVAAHHDWQLDTLRALHAIWTRPVHIETAVEGKSVVWSFDGENESSRDLGKSLLAVEV